VPDDFRPPLEVTVRSKPIDINDKKYQVKSDKTGSGGGAEKVDDYERRTRSIADRTKTIEAQTTAQASVNPLINDYDFALNKARTTQELLNAAQKAGLTVTPAMTSAIDALSSKYATAQAEAQKLAKSQDDVRAAMDDAKGFGKDTLSGFISDLRQGKSATEALTNALNRMADKLIDMALNSMFGLPGGLGSIGKLFGSLLGGGGGVGAPMSILPGLADGGYTGSGGRLQPAGIVHRGEYVMDADSVRKAGGPAAFDGLRASLKGYAGGGYVGPQAARPGAGGAVTPVNVTVNNNAPDTRATAKTDSNGNTVVNVDSLVDSITAKQAQNVSRGRGALATAFSRNVPRIG
jgi:hypothetical protein